MLPREPQNLTENKIAEEAQALLAMSLTSDQLPTTVVFSPQEKKRKGEATTKKEKNPKNSKKFRTLPSNNEPKEPWITKPLREWLESLPDTDSRRTERLLTRFAGHLYDKNYAALLEELETYKQYWIDRTEHKAIQANRNIAPEQVLHKSLRPVFSFVRDGMQPILSFVRYGQQNGSLYSEKDFQHVRSLKKLPLGYSFTALLVEECIDDPDGRSFLEKAFSFLRKITSQATFPTPPEETYQWLFDQLDPIIRSEKLVLAIEFFGNLLKEFKASINITRQIYSLQNYFKNPDQQIEKTTLISNLVSLVSSNRAQISLDSLQAIFVCNHMKLASAVINQHLAIISEDTLRQHLQNIFYKMIVSDTSNYSSKLEIKEIIQAYLFLEKFQTRNGLVINLAPEKNLALIKRILAMFTGDDLGASSNNFHFIKELIAKFPRDIDLNDLSRIVDVIAKEIDSGSNTDGVLGELLNLYDHIRECLIGNYLLSAKPIHHFSGKVYSELDYLIKLLIDDSHFEFNLSKSLPKEKVKKALLHFKQKNIGGFDAQSTSAIFVEELEKIDRLAFNNQHTNSSQFKIAKIKKVLEVFMDPELKIILEPRKIKNKVLELHNIHGSIKMQLLAILFLQIPDDERTNEFYLEACLVHLKSLRIRHTFLNSHKEKDKLPMRLCGTSSSSLAENHTSPNDQQDIILTDYFLNKLSSNSFKSIFTFIANLFVINHELIQHHVNHYQNSPRFADFMNEALQKNQLMDTDMSAASPISTPTTIFSEPQTDPSFGTSMQTTDTPAPTSVFYPKHQDPLKNFVNSYLPANPHLKDQKIQIALSNIKDFVKKRCDQETQNKLAAEVNPFLLANPNISCQEALPTLLAISGKFLQTIPSNPFLKKNERNDWCWDIPAMQANRWLEFTFGSIFTKKFINTEISVVSLLTSIWLGIHDTNIFSEAQQIQLREKFIEVLAQLEQRKPQEGYNDIAITNVFYSLLEILNNKHSLVNLSHSYSYYLSKLIINFYDEKFSQLSEFDKLKLISAIDSTERIPPSFLQNHFQAFMNTQIDYIARKPGSVQEIRNLLESTLIVAQFPRIKIAYQNFRNQQAARIPYPVLELAAPAIEMLPSYSNSSSYLIPSPKNLEFRNSFGIFNQESKATSSIFAPASAVRSDLSIYEWAEIKNRNQPQ